MKSTLVFVLVLFLSFTAIGGGELIRNESTPETAIERLASAPLLEVNLSSETFDEPRVRAKQLGSSWFVEQEDGSWIVWMSDSPGPLQLGPADYRSATLRLTDVNDTIELRFADDFAPDSISVECWLAIFATGRQDVYTFAPAGTPVDAENDRIPVCDDGNDYIYVIEAVWENNGSNYGDSIYAFA